jgi:hypothetical protein
MSPGIAVRRRQPMRPVAKASLVALGYVAALAVTLLVAGIHLAETSGADRQGGMSAFGDSLMLLAVFGLAAVPATVLRILVAPLFAMLWLLSGLFPRPAPPDSRS